MFGKTEVRGVVAFIILSLGIIMLFYKSPFMYLTGDETRYFMYSYSILRFGHLFPSASAWEELYFGSTHMETKGLPLIAGGIGHPVYLTTILSPIAYEFKLSGLRFVSTIAGLFGLLNIFKISRHAIPGDKYRTIIALFLTAFSIPLLPYMNLFYMEVFLFAFAAWGWRRIHTAPPTVQADLITGLIILAIPFIHLRGAVVGATLFLMFLLKIWNDRKADHRYGYFLAFLGMAFLALLLLSGFNLIIYGDISGSVNSARPPSPRDMPSTIAMQLFNIRHGLFAYGPVWILGYAGLVAGFVRKNRVCMEGLVLAIVAMCTSIGPNPGECWPARFWVLSIPMLSLGLSYWIHRLRGTGSYLVTSMLVGITLLNTALFFVHPNAFLENRQATASYQMLFEKFGSVNFGLVLPIEIPGEIQTSLANGLGLVSLGLVAILSLAYFRPVLSWIAILVLVCAIDLARVNRLSAETYHAVFARQDVEISLDHPQSRAVYLQFGPEWLTWSVPPNWPRLAISATDATGGAGRWIVYADQIIGVSCLAPVRAIDVDTAEAPEVRAAMDGTINVYQSRSFIRNFLARRQVGCNAR